MSDRELQPRGDAQSEELRQQLSRIFAEWRELFARCIAEGQASGEIGSNAAATDLAGRVLAGWHGAMPRMKVERSAAPLEQFKNITFESLFRS